MKDLLYYIYIIRCENNYLYTGITTDIQRRFNEHQTDKKRGAKFTRINPPLKIEIVWKTNNRSTATKLEYAIKSLSKQTKEDLISKKKTIYSIWGEKFMSCQLN